MARCRNAESITVDEMPGIYNAYPNKNDLTEGDTDENQENLSSNSSPKKKQDQIGTPITLTEERVNDRTGKTTRKCGRPPNKGRTQANVIPKARYNLRNSRK